LRALSRAYFRLEAEGARRLPRQGGAIVAGNHPSVLDGILLWAISPRPVRFLIAEDMYRHPLLSPLFRALGGIEVSRTKTHNGDALRSAVAALEEGQLLGIFPEGTIHDRGRMRQVKQGVALLAMKSGAPVIPFAIQGSREAFPDGARAPRPRPIRLRFGEPVVYPRATAERIPEEEVAGVREDIRRRIVGVMDRGTARIASRRVPGWLECASIALAASAIVPLGSLLTLTANPSLDPAAQR